ncbi:hypothetical protein HanIR_Chr14g0710191 [Helianthus annuus]|nr:hypothetical protein HanIR_Chr14g0710191 [Helianthus annuus]
MPLKFQQSAPLNVLVFTRKSTFNVHKDYVLWVVVVMLDQWRWWGEG